MSIFFTFYRINEGDFDYLLFQVRPLIEKTFTHWRELISPETGVNPYCNTNSSFIFWFKQGSGLFGPLSIRNLQSVTSEQLSHQHNIVAESLKTAIHVAGCQRR